MNDVFLTHYEPLHHIRNAFLRVIFCSFPIASKTSVPCSTAILSLILPLKPCTSNKMNPAIFCVFFWVVGGLSKVNDSCSFVDVGETIHAQDFLAK